MLVLCIEICVGYNLWGVIWVVKSLSLSRFWQREFHRLHLFVREVIREVRIYLSDKSLGTITHPNINDIGANVLLANVAKVWRKQYAVLSASSSFIVIHLKLCFIDKIFCFRGALFPQKVLTIHITKCIIVIDTNVIRWSYEGTC